jgi:predicted component of type VI protein secretion system
MTQTLILYSLLASGLAACLTLFWSVKREVHAYARKNRNRMDELSRTLHAPASEPEPIYVLAPPRSSLNISKRVQAMRMVRRNENVSHIAAALGVTRREVELLIRVQQIKPAV